MLLHQIPYDMLRKIEVLNPHQSRLTQFLSFKRT